MEYILRLGPALNLLFRIVEPPRPVPTYWSLYYILYYITEDYSILYYIILSIPKL